MTEDEARTWIEERFGPVGLARMQVLVDSVLSEVTTQNLIAPSTIDVIWARHIVDSAQLVALVSRGSDVRWTDIGTGAGFPGLVIAALTDCRITLVEPRKLRAAYLEATVMALGIADRTKVVQGKVQSVTEIADIVSARAVASVSTMLHWCAGMSSLQTYWLFLKGRTAREEVVEARKSWHGTFHVEHSITDPESLIVCATGVARR